MAKTVEHTRVHSSSLSLSLSRYACACRSAGHSWDWCLVFKVHSKNAMLSAVQKEYSLRSVVERLTAAGTMQTVPPPTPLAPNLRENVETPPKSGKNWSLRKEEREREREALSSFRP